MDLMREWLLWRNIIKFRQRKNKEDYYCEDDGYSSARTSLYSSTITTPSSGPSPSNNSRSTSESSPRSYSKPKFSSTSKRRSKSSAASFPSPYYHPFSPSPLSSSALHHNEQLQESYSFPNSVFSPVESSNSSLLSPVTSVNTSLNASSYIDPMSRSSFDLLSRSRSSSLSSPCTCSSKRKDVSFAKLSRVVRSSYELLDDEVFEDIVEQLEELDESGHSPAQSHEKMVKGNYEVIKKAMNEPEEDKNDESFANESESSNNSIKQLLSRRVQR